jgi:phosphoribosylformylglycinamidine synthase II
MFRNDVPITPELVAQHGLTPDEYERFRGLIGRDPTLTELGIVSAMWNEHCSYKSSRKHLRGLPTSAPWVIQGPGENAGVIDIGDGHACVFKMESHNHPSYIEPYQGAATGVGGILRDVFTMGARPIAALNALRFGSPDHPRTRSLVSGVVAGVGGYGNSFGVPTVGGLTGFHRRYDGNILVNAMAVGSKTGRDGIHGATMASAEFDEESESKRPTVQVGDPFAEKLLLEACLELMASGAVIAIQDMGAAGLTCSAVEMGAKGDLGVELDIDKVPAREAGMTPYEMMLSESQERMLMVLKPGMEAEAEAIFVKWGLDFAVIGRTTDTLRFVIKWHGETVADLPIKELGDEAPLYDRPHLANTHQPVIAAAEIPAPASLTDALKRLVGSPDLASKRWVFEQYDHFILGNTVQKPGGDAAIVRVEDGPKGLALTCDVTPRYCEADPVEGGRQAVAEAWRNITAVGAKPLAITDNLNFGNPEKPEVMGQLVGCLQGIGEACRALDFPVVSGNVSLYNETNGVGILPTPTIGGVGVLDDVARHATIALKRAGDVLVLIGASEGWLGQSSYLSVIEGREEGAPPPVDLALERRNGDFVRGLIQAGTVDTVHDLADGGLAVALAEMAMAGGLGAALPDVPVDLAAHAYLFGEDQARYLLAVKPDVATDLLAAAAAQGIAVASVGVTGSDRLTLPGGETISLADLNAVHEGWLPAYMASQPAAPAA